MKSWFLFLMLVVSTSPLKAALLGYAYDLELLADDGSVAHTLNTSIVVDTETREFLTVDVFLDQVETFSTNKPLDWNEWVYSEETNSWSNTCWADADSNYFAGRNMLLNFDFIDVFVPEGADPMAFNPYENLDQLGWTGVWVTFDDGSTYLATAPANKWDLGPVEIPVDTVEPVGSVSVPEPATWALVMLGLLSFAMRGRRTRV